MRKTCDPTLHTMLASEFIFSYQHMNPAIIISSFIAQVPAKNILLDPVNLKVSKWLPIPKTNGRKRVVGSKICLEELLLDGLGTRTAPELTDSVDIHPFVQKLEIGHHQSVLGLILWRWRREIRNRSY
jgi:hypothetical protein